MSGSDREVIAHVPAPRNAVLIVNTHSRRGEALFEAAKKGLKTCGLNVETAYAATSEAEFTGRARECIERGVDLVVVGGGDGTIRSAAAAFANTEVTLGIIPLGTVNDLARNLRIDLDLPAACRVLSEGTVCRIDLGRANDEIFAITASLGFSALMQRALSPRLKRIFGPLGYFVASLRTWRWLRHLEIAISGDHGAQRFTTMQAGIVNGHSWMGGRFHIPGIDLESGRLAFYAVPPTTNLGYIKMILHVRRGGFFTTPGMLAFTTADLTLTTSRPQPLVLDGDLRGETPVRFTVMPDALKVVAPKDYLRQGPPEP